MFVLLYLGFLGVLSLTTADTSTQVKCRGEFVGMQCNSGFVLEIQTVSYLRNSASICDNGNNTSDTSCDASASALSVVKQLCNDKASCQFAVDGLKHGCNTDPYFEATFSCKACPAGTFQSAHGCEPCPLGEYQIVDGASGQCAHTCPSASTTTKPGAKNAQDCLPGYGIGPICAQEKIQLDCPAGKVITSVSGYYGRLNNFICHVSHDPDVDKVCVDHSFSGTLSSKCDKKNSCEHQVSGTINNCAGGLNYAYVTWLCQPTDLDACPVGSYSKNGKITPDPCTDCTPGHYQDLPGQTSCKKCPQGKYQVSSGENACIECQNGQTTSSVGSDNIDDCYTTSSALTDPHFMITHPNTREHFCFDYNGKNNQIFRLIGDEENDIYVNGKLFDTSKNPENSSNYFANIAIITKFSKIVFYRNYINLNGQNISWYENKTILSLEVRLVPGERNTSFVVNFIEKEISFVVTRSSSSKFGPYLGLFTENIKGLSDHCNGVLGQFMHRDFHTFQGANGKHYATFSFPAGLRIVEVSEKSRLYPARHKSVSCWLYSTIDDEHSEILSKDVIQQSLYSTEKI